MAVIDDLDGHVARFTAALEARGGTVYFAKTAEEASAYVADVCKRKGAKLAAKSKSMASEEIGLNAALEAVGVKPVETDLGEYILQLAGEHPVHIVAPAIEKTAGQVAELLSAVGGKKVPPELEALTNAARTQLRETFLKAEVGITGANFGVSETGSICLVTNEGNARLVSSIPPGACGDHGDGAARAERRRPRRAAAAACAVGNGATADGVHDSAHGAAANRRARRSRPNSTLSFWTTAGRICCAAATARCSRAFAAARA